MLDSPNASLSFRRGSIQAEALKIEDSSSITTPRNRIERADLASPDSVHTRLAALSFGCANSRTHLRWNTADDVKWDTCSGIARAGSPFKSLHPAQAKPGRHIFAPASKGPLRAPPNSTTQGDELVACKSGRSRLGLGQPRRLFCCLGRTRRWNLTANEIAHFWDETGRRRYSGGPSKIGVLDPSAGLHPSRTQPIAMRFSGCLLFAIRHSTRRPAPYAIRVLRVFRPPLPPPSNRDTDGLHARPVGSSSARAHTPRPLAISPTPPARHFRRDLHGRRTCPRLSATSIDTNINGRWELRRTIFASPQTHSTAPTTLHETNTQAQRRGAVRPHASRHAHTASESHRIPTRRLPARYLIRSLRHRAALQLFHHQRGGRRVDPRAAPNHPPRARVSSARTGRRPDLGFRCQKGRYFGAPEVLVLLPVVRTQRSYQAASLIVFGGGRTARSDRIFACNTNELAYPAFCARQQIDSNLFLPPSGSSPSSSPCSASSLPVRPLAAR
ncbi:hypothetical protein B0H16DRAFT_1719347 [Mycena metata]|uniref:Uncharacterized protein n=1 Tax=Mycena metata TaxID=1033252 RepID=A0AAD7JFX1_9AGAR|nr:hypothetical protein B0H16DRAFT_1719347 [Mycena metata]